VHVQCEPVDVFNVMTMWGKEIMSLNTNWCGFLLPVYVDLLRHRLLLWAVLKTPQTVLYTQSFAAAQRSFSLLLQRSPVFTVATP